MKRLLLLLLIASPAAAQVGTHDELPVPLPERPFVLLDAPRRFLPSEPAEVRVQVRDGGTVQLSVFRVNDPSLLLGQAGRRNGMSVAATPIGARAEEILALRTPLPRRTAELTLTRLERIAMPRADGARRVGDETAVYDSNEEIEENVATYWVRTGNWAVRRVALGRLDAGLYMVQVRAAAWVASALVSVGEMVVVARRGDRADLVRITDADGGPLANVTVRALDGARERASAVTDADGIARFAASDAEVLRFRADRAGDVAWADVSHVRLAPCDPRVYVATGRPTVRDGEPLFVRGHVRGCAADRFAPLANRTVRLESGGSTREVRTDADGNFAVELVASQTLTATLEGRAHQREVRIDHRELPTRNLIVETDRPWAAAGEVVEVRVRDEEGGWPTETDVVLDTPSGQLVAPIGNRSPAVFHVRVPDTATDRMTLHASLAAPGSVTLATTEIFVGRTPVQLELDGAERGTSGESFEIEARAVDLGGAPVSGNVRLALYGSDGNRAIGAARHRMEVPLRGGVATLRMPLSGEGPWMVRAERGRAEAELVVWSRRGPPPLGDRGELAIAPNATRAPPGAPLAVRVRAPSAGAAWLTLEQGGVLEHRAVRGAGEHTLNVPDAARGLATLVLTHVHRGQVRTASATVEVETSVPFELDVATDRPAYGAGEHARVTIEAKREDRRPHDAVVSLWLADAGYWGLGDETYPMPDDYFRLPGRSASAADSSVPVAFGAEEGRRLDSELVLDGHRLERSTHRHGWGYGGEVVRVSSRGSFAVIAHALARAARLRGATVDCPDDTRQHVLNARDLPWDLIAERVAEALNADVSVADQRLVYECGGGAGYGGLGRFGTGGGGGGVGMGTVGAGSTRSERLEGVQHFVGLARLGADGRIELDVPMPDHPGRWRIEVLAIADDGAGARDHRVVHTRTALDAWLEMPRDLAPGDVAQGIVHVESHTGADRATVELRVPSHLAITGAPATIALDANGRGHARFEITARGEGDRPFELRVAAGSAHDTIAAALTVHPPSTERSIYFGAVIGGGPVQIDVPLPELAQDATLALDLDESAEREARRLFDALREPRWDLSATRADRLASLAALHRVARASRMPFAADIRHAIESELHALAGLQTSTGEIGWGDEPDPRLTLEVLEHVPPEMADDWSAARAYLVERLSRGELHGDVAARAARLVDAARATPVLRGVVMQSDDPIALTEALRSADHLELSALRAQAADRLIRAIDARLAAGQQSSCRGWAYWLCFARRGDRGVLARAALALREVGDRRAASVAGRVGAWLASQPAAHADFVWGSDEADVLELLATQPRGADTVRAVLDGRPLAIERGRVHVPAGAHRLELHFAARRGRLRRVVLTGTAEVRAPASAQGNVRLARSFARRDGRWELAVTYTLPRPASDVVLEVPIPAGLTPELRELRGAAIVDGALRVRARTLRGGPHELRVPMLETGAGSFTAAPAHLESVDAELFGMTPSQRVEVR